MKCPLLKQVNYERNENDNSVAYTYETFADCMLEGCPYFSSEIIDYKYGDGRLFKQVKECYCHETRCNWSIEIELKAEKEMEDEKK